MLVSFLIKNLLGGNSLKKKHSSVATYECLWTLENFISYCYLLESNYFMKNCTGDRRLWEIIIY